MRAINIHEAKTHLSKLVEQAANGEPFVIAKAGKPMVKVVAVDAPEQTAAEKAQRRLGFLRGKVTIPDDFDTFMRDEIIEMFEGDPNKFERVRREALEWRKREEK